MLCWKQFLSAFSSFTWKYRCQTHLLKYYSWEVKCWAVPKVCCIPVCSSFTGMCLVYVALCLPWGETPRETPGVEFGNTNNSLYILHNSYIFGSFLSLFRWPQEFSQGSLHLAPLRLFNFTFLLMFSNSSRFYISWRSFCCLVWCSGSFMSSQSVKIVSQGLDFASVVILSGS